VSTFTEKALHAMTKYIEIFKPSAQLFYMETVPELNTHRNNTAQKERRKTKFIFPYLSITHKNI
jgi:predicted 3-demethylubiquinone-9 3-methyltransferase (glyoxalase superfamily)